MEVDQASAAIPSPASAIKSSTGAAFDMDVLVVKLDRIEDRLKNLEEKQVNGQSGRQRRPPAVATHIQLKQALISRLHMLEGRILQLRSAMDTATKTNSATNEIVEVPLLQEGATSVEKADNLVDKKINKGYRRLQQTQKSGLIVKDPKQGRKKVSTYRSERRGLNKEHGRLYRCFAMGC